MLLHINGMFTMGKLKSSRLSYSFILNRPSRSISRYRLWYKADLTASVISFISSSMGKMRSTKSPNVYLFSDKTSSVYRNVKINGQTSFFLIFIRRPYVKYVLRELIRTTIGEKGGTAMTHMKTTTTKP